MLNLKIRNQSTVERIEQMLQNPIPQHSINFSKLACTLAGIEAQIESAINEELLIFTLYVAYICNGVPVLDRLACELPDDIKQIIRDKHL